MKIQSLGMAALFTAVGVSYIWWPFQVPVGSICGRFDCDSPIDVRPPFNVKIFRLL